MNGQQTIQRILHENFLKRRERNSAFSLRAFAKQLNISAASLSEILNGKRSVSEEFAIRIAEKLCIDPKETHQLIESFGNGKQKRKKNKAIDNYLQLEADKHNIISEWYHFAILSLVETYNFNPDPKNVASRLGISIREATQAIDRLLRLDMLAKNSEGGIVSTGKQFITSDNVANVSLRKCHYNNLDLARHSLDQDDVTQRDFTSITMAIDSKRLPEAKKRVREFLNEISQFLEVGKRNEVYKLCVQLFPLTKGEENEGN